MPSRQRFREHLEMQENFTASMQNPERSTRDLILRYVLDDHMDIMSDLREALDYIDEHVSDDEVLRSCLQNWRHLLGQWKKNFSNDVQSIAYLGQFLLLQSSQNPDEHGQMDRTTSRHGSVNYASKPPEQGDFHLLAQEVKGLTERVSSTFQSIMATMAIVESRKAIVQAEKISKLTNLAFFFIPLTLCSSVFGMNIVVSLHTHLNLLDI